MDIPYGAWLPELDMDDLHEFINQHQQMHPYGECVDLSSSPIFNGCQNQVTRDQYINANTISDNMDTQGSCMTTRTSSFAPVAGSTSRSFTVSFEDFTSPTTTINQNQVYGGYEFEYADDVIKSREEMNLNELLGSIELPKRASNTRRNRRQAKEHILAERRRREKLTQRFISLSALLPEIKKMDKATVLEDASRYIKRLQSRVKELEEESISGKHTNQESTTEMRKSKFHEVEVCSFDETNSYPCNATYNPGVKVRKLGSNVLVRIYCERNSSLALKALTEMERLNFIVMCNSVLPISDTAILITIIAQMNEEFVVTAKDLVKCLQFSLSNF
ncbi:hypothetical protein QVD17_06481 [Tagetes erecta]|uniref:BHLH domain-containing protein n=1 Tax=Tagetes erecta TaxID=13708 RepID=A0AAD8LLS8_TARER|nr:hypothetical protein QVD17_06481 [Tagetes erecta]